MAFTNSDGTYFPLIVRPRIARKLLGDCGTERLYELLNSGAIESFVDGRARWIVVASINRYIAKRLAGAGATPALAPAAAPPRRSGSPRKNGCAGPVTP
jgi:hypothetical protein